MYMYLYTSHIFIREKCWWLHLPSPEVWIRSTQTKAPDLNTSSVLSGMSSWKPSRNLDFHETSPFVGWKGYNQILSYIIVKCPE